MMDLDHVFLPSERKKKRKEAYHPTNCIQSGMIATPINLLLVSGGECVGCSFHKEKKLVEMAFIQLYRGKLEHLLN